MLSKGLAKVRKRYIGTVAREVADDAASSIKSTKQAVQGIQRFPSNPAICSGISSSYIWCEMSAHALEGEGVWPFELF